MVSRPFVVTPTQTAIAINYRNDRLSLVADRFLPRVQVGSSRFKWAWLPPAQAFTVPETQVGRRGRLNRVEFQGEERTSETFDYGLESAIPEQDIRDAEAMMRNNIGSFDPVNTATELLTDLILLDREVRVAALAQDPANYAPANRVALSGSDQFSDPASDVIGIFKSCFEKPQIYRPNTATMSRPTWGKISSHPQLVNAVKGNVISKGIIKPSDFVDLFSGEGLTELLIGESFVNTARPGQMPTLNRVWHNHISLTFINPNARPESGATFGMSAQFGSRVAGWREDPDIGLDGGRVVRVGERVREIVTAPELGCLIQNAVAA